MWPFLFRTIVLSLCLLNAFQVLSQSAKGQILDQKTGDPLAFVSVVEKATLNGTYSDIDGYFTFTTSANPAELVFSLVGYRSLTIMADTTTTTNVKMVEKDNLLSEVVIRPGINPAERIISQAIENKKKNNPESDVAFTYDSYNKLAFGAAIDTTILNDSVKFSKLDSSAQSMYTFLDQQYLFFMESATHRKFIPPDKSEETIVANRVSGLKNTDFFLLGTQLQSFSFYGENVELLGIIYMSPLADKSINKYLFILEDTTYIGPDTIFTISFQPRKNKNFDGMKGQLFINTNGYAIQNVLARPAESESFDIQIQQQYEFLDNKKWFPKQLNSNIIFKTLVIDTAPMTGEGRSYIKNVKLDAPLSKKEFTPVSLLMAAGATNQPDSVWDKYRERDLTIKEQKTYTTVDSIGKAENLDRTLKGLEALTTGQINFGWLSFDLQRLIAYNSFEKYRLGGGLRTSNLLSDKFNIGGYYGYGFGDKHSKYGGDLQIALYRKRNAWLKILYQNDVKELGGNQIDLPVEGLSLANIYPFFVSRMDRREKKEISLSGRLLGNLSGSAFLNQQFVKTFDSYRFRSFTSENISLYTSEFNVTETGVQLRLAPGEKIVRTSNREIRLGGRFPVLLFQYTRGIQNATLGDFEYTKLDFRIDKIFHINNVGDFSTAAIAGYIPDNLPLSLLYNARGTWQKFTIATPQAFETMRTNEFQHSEFIAIHLRHNFKDLLLKTKNFAPHIILVHNMIWGKFQYPEDHNFEIKSANQGYYESGIQIDNLLKSNISGIGIGAFYRYGPYHLSNNSDNFAFKLSSSLIF